MELDLTPAAIVGFLRDKGYRPGYVEPAGAGAWSSCFGFTHDDQELVVRFGRHLDDFEKDRYAVRFAASGLPVPELLELGPAFGAHYAVSKRVRGTPLEQVGSEQWIALVPAVVDVLETLRLTPLSGPGWGGWDGDGQAPEASWRAHLLTVGDGPMRSAASWRDALVGAPDAVEIFDDGYAVLETLGLAAVGRSLIHADLINRNVHVIDDRVTGVFDWGCSRYGDHLYDCAWFEFWSPWYPDLDTGLLFDALQRRWASVDYEPEDAENRRRACLLHIGLDHIVYNALHGTEADRGAAAARTIELGLI